MGVGRPRSQFANAVRNFANAVRNEIKKCREHALRAFSGRELIGLAGAVFLYRWDTF